MTRQIHKTPPILKLTHNFEARVCTLFIIYLRSLKGKVVHWTLTLSQDLQVFMSQCTPPPPPPSLLLLPCPYLSIGLGYLGGVKNRFVPVSPTPISPTMICPVSPTPISPTPEMFSIPVSPTHSVRVNNKIRLLF